MTSKSRSIQSILDSVKDNSTVDMGYLGSHAWSAEIDTNTVLKSIHLVNFPTNLTKIILGYNLSHSISGTLELPQFLEHFKGPIFDDTKLPVTLKNLIIVETMSCVSLSRMKIPDSTTNLTIITRDKLSRVDEIQFPKTIETLKIEGPFNASLDNLDFTNYNNLKNVYFPPSFKQHFLTENKNLIVTRKNMNENLEMPDNLDKPIDENVSVVSSPRINMAISKYLPFLNHFIITLDDTTPTISDIWINILHEGMVRVKKITIKVPETHAFNPFYDVDRVFERSHVLKRKLCDILIINNVTFNKEMINSYLNMAHSLKRIGNMIISINHTKMNFDPKGLLKTMSLELGIQPNPSSYNYCSLFGVNESSLSIIEKKINIYRGDVPIYFSADVLDDEFEAHPPIYSSHLIVPMEDIDASPPKGKNITLHTWSQCGFCKKQDQIIEEFKKIDDENSDMFENLVDVQKIDNPNSISDKRIKAFPSWVVNGNIESGVKSSEQIENMFKEINS